MKNHTTIILSACFSIFLLTNCNNSGSNQTSEKDLELQKKELDLKQKELELKEKQLAFDSIQNANQQKRTLTTQEQAAPVEQAKVSTQDNSSNPVTPIKGSKDREEILDLFRTDFRGMNNIEFKVWHFLINKNWACANVTPLKDNEDYAEPRWGLFEKTNNIWKEIKLFGVIKFNSDNEATDLPLQNSRVAKLITKKFPTCPMNIFGLKNEQS